MRDLSKEEFDAFVKRMLREAPGDEESEEEAAEEESEDEAEEEESGEEAEEEDTEEAEDEDAEEDKKVVVTTGSELDKEIQSVLIDFESSALSKSEIGESLFYKNGIKTLINENTEFSLDSFASDVARLIKNYDNLIDMKSIILKKSLSFVEDKYGEEASKNLEDILSGSHSIDQEPKQEPEAPLATGASKEAASE